MNEHDDATTTSLGLFASDNPAWRRHQASIAAGVKRKDQVVPSRRAGGAVPYMDGDERIAHLMAGDVATDPAPHNRADAALHPSWEVKPSGRAPRRRPTAVQHLTHLWTARNCRVVVVVALVAILCTGHIWRLVKMLW